MTDPKTNPKKLTKIQWIIILAPLVLQEVATVLTSVFDWRCNTIDFIWFKVAFPLSLFCYFYGIYAISIYKSELKAFAYIVVMPVMYIILFFVSVMTVDVAVCYY